MTRKDWFKLSFFIAVSLFVFYKVAGNGFVADITGWILQYQKLGWKGVLNSFEDKSLHHVYHLATFTLYKVFGFDKNVWWLVFGSLHGINAFLVFRFVKLLLLRWEFRSHNFVATASALLFLLSPYHAEPVIWSATIHYLIATAGILLALYYTLQYASNPNPTRLIVIHACFLIALFALEITFALPFIIIVMLLFAPSKIWNSSRNKVWLNIVGVQILLIAVYFLLNKIVLGKWIGHYGAEDHLGVSIPYLAANFTKYIFKHLLFAQFWEFSKREHWYFVFEKEGVAKLLLASYISLGVLLLIVKEKLPQSIRALSLMLALFAISLLPVISLYFNYIVLNECDRMSYFSTVFSSIFLALVVALSGKFLRIPAMAALLILSFTLLKQNVYSWKVSGEVMSGLVQDFKWHKNKNVVVLSIADNFRGAYVSRSFKGNENLKDVFRMYQIPIEANIFEVINFNMNNENDCMNIEVLSPNQLKVSFAQGGNWFWYNGVGAGSYENDFYKVEIDEWNSSYVFTRKEALENAAYIYQCGKSWKEVNW